MLIITALSLTFAFGASNPAEPDPKTAAGGSPQAAVSSVFVEPIADAGNALEICCAAGYCTFVAINECSLLTPEGKIIALMSATVGGFGGLVGGLAVGVGGFLLAERFLPAGSAFAPFKGGDVLLTLALLTGAAGIVTGGVLGSAAAFVLDVWFLRPPPPPRRRRRHYSSRELPPQRQARTSSESAAAF